MSDEIKLVNRIIAEAVMHGADMGGSYDSNEQDLTEAITDWLKSKGVDNEYCVKEIDVIKNVGKYNEHWRILQICEK
jgi:hypothetical protein